jgi:hypothetical protein
MNFQRTDQPAKLVLGLEDRPSMPSCSATTGVRQQVLSYVLRDAVTYGSVQLS